jgi:hypothetical protein
MPTMASITVKKYDGVTDIIYDQQAGSGGDESPAFWRQDTGQAAALPTAFRPTLKVWGRWNGPKTARVVKGTFTYPYAVQDTTTTLYSSKDKCIGNFDFLSPQGMPPSGINEAGYQFGNLMGSTLVKLTMVTGYAPT